MKRRACVLLTTALLVCGACARNKHPSPAAGTPHAVDHGDGSAAPLDGEMPGPDASTDAAAAVSDAAVQSPDAALNTMDARVVADGGESGLPLGLPSLLGLTVSTGLLAPAFDPQVTSYVLDVPLATDTIELTPQAESDCTIAIAGKRVDSGEAWQSASLALGENAIAIATSVLGQPARVYTVVVTRSRLPLAIEPTAEDGTRFGARVAVSGDTLAISSHRDDGCALAIWVRDGDTFHLQARVQLRDQALNPAACANRISLALDGDTLVMGAPNVDDPGDGTGNNVQTSVGAVYVIVRSGQSWTQVATLHASEPHAGDQFGESVAVSGDTILIGAPFADGVGGTDSGAAYVFVHQAGGFIQTTQLTASNAGAGDGFGASVALSGNTAVVSAPSEDSSAQGVDGDQHDETAADSGAAYVFERAQDVWMQRAYLKATRPYPSLTPQAGGDQFGGGDTFPGPGVAIWADRIAIGSAGEDSRATPEQMSAGHGAIADTGAVYLFARSGDHWNYQTRLEPQAQFRYGNALFGGSVALWGSRLIVGAWEHGGTGVGISEGPVMDGMLSSGAAFTFEETADGWVAREYLKSSAPLADADFGWSVGISEHALAVGAPAATTATAAAGSAYVFP